MNRRALVCKDAAGIKFSSRPAENHRAGVRAGSLTAPARNRSVRPVLASRPMKTRFASAAPALLLLALPARAAETAPPAGWHAQTLGQALGYMVLFSAVGIVAAIAGYKLFDKCTPGDLHKEILENRNVAAAIVAGAVVLGVCIIIAAAMLG